MKEITVSKRNLHIIVSSLWMSYQSAEEQHMNWLFNIHYEGRNKCQWNGRCKSECSGHEYDSLPWNGNLKQLWSTFV